MIIMNRNIGPGPFGTAFITFIVMLKHNGR
jgi:hypothetical protein